ncbi:hypothetical protein PoB_001427600 [Plakobranchus ocellatus]|uniref:DH domain-containing protein n=1 Tax=Plakobranchus ocellatus TaxID=259542 RepID=A0AAV3YKH2_9GAST|nr:hypothetical protein PoB_001427600 [Plakobranchus ocellatus]
MSLSGEAVLYVSSPNDKIAQEAARQERRRRKILKELVDTEKRYLHHLQLINKYFYFPLKFAYIVPDAVHNILFSNLEQIYDVNVTLLEQIEQSTVGAAFSQMGPFLKLYSTYANNHQHALNTMQEWQTKSQEFADFISKQEDLPPVMGLKLPALLITPVQRIPRYKLLLEELLYNTPKEHYDYEKIKEATAVIEEIATHINEHIRQNENFQKMLSIQRSFDSSAPKLLAPGRTFIKEGPLKKVSRKGGKAYERMFFLFSDILLYGKPKFLDGGSKSYTCSCVLPLRHCKVEPVFITSVKKTEAGGVFKLSCQEENLLLYSDDKENAQQWSEELDRAIRKFCDDRQTLRKPSSNKVPLRGRSLRRHRKEQKKTETKIYGTTPLRPLSLVRASSPESDSHSNRSSWYQLSDSCDLDSSVDLSENVQASAASPKVTKEEDLEPAIRLQDQCGGFPTIDESPTGPVTRVTSHYSLRSSTSLENISPDMTTLSTDCQTVELRRERCRASLKRPADRCESTKPGLKKTSNLSLPPCSSTAWYPPNSPAHKLRQKNSLNSRLRSYLRKPFRRIQQVKRGVASPCSPLRCRNTVKHKGKV